MSDLPPAVACLVRGRVPGEWPLTLHAVLGDLRPAFIPKGTAGRGHRAVARNGRVLLAADRPVDGLTGRAAVVRFQTWHRAVLPGEPPEPYGVLLCVRTAGELPGSVGELRLTGVREAGAGLCVDLGGRRWLVWLADESQKDLL
jgi:hypothetical protein